ncbi:MAG: oxidoreductase, partial [Bacteroidales bacterium]|nr:oxidoreductase [Bacteroidales bacterium]
VDNNEIEFSGGFTDLHTQTYQHILDGKGFKIMEAKPAIDTVYNIRNATPIGLKGEYHEMCNNIKS